MPKNKRKHRIAQRFTDPSVRVMVAVFLYGQPFYTKPLCYITREQRDQWRDQGSGTTYDRGTIFELSKPTTDRLLTGNSALGACLIWAVLRSDKEAKAKLELLRWNPFSAHNRIAAA